MLLRNGVSTGIGGLGWCSRRWTAEEKIHAEEQSEQEKGYLLSGEDNARVQQAGVDGAGGEFGPHTRRISLRHAGGPSSSLSAPVSLIGRVGKRRTAGYKRLGTSAVVRRLTLREASVLDS